ncbi:MAG: alpha/beta fold hydrolase [Solirubrobacterales bacterium]
MASLPYKEARLANGEVMAYKECGQGPDTIFFVHGNMVTTQCWEAFMQTLPPQYRCIACDLRGAGETTYNRPIELIRQFSNDLFFFCQELNLTRFVLVGLSMGGAVVQQFAVDYPEKVEKLVLMDSVPSRGYPDPFRDETGKPVPGRFRNRWEQVETDPVQILPIWLALRSRDYEAMRTIFSRAVFNVKTPDESFYKEFIENCFTIRNYPDCAWAIDIFNIGHTFNGVSQGTGEIDKLVMPTLVMVGEKDLVFSVDSARQTAEDIGANAEFTVISNSGHIPAVDNPDEVREKLLAFIRKQ